MDADLILVDLLGAFYPVHVLLGDHLGVRAHHIIQGEDHVVDGERVAIVESDAFANGQIERLWIDPLPLVAGCASYLPVIGTR